MNTKKKKLGLKLNLNMDHIDENNNNENINKDIPNNNLNVEIGLMSDKDSSNINLCLNKGINKNQRPCAESTNELDLIYYYLYNPCITYDFSYYWIEKNNNIKRIAEPIKVEINSSFKEPIRDLYCEYELIKLICDSSLQKNNFIELPKFMKKLNRYSDILPCKIYNIFIYI